MAPTDEDTFKERLRLAATGDRAAQDALTAEFYDRVSEVVHHALQQDFRRRHKWILPLFSTRDVVHDVLTNVLRRLESTDFPNPAAFVAYLSTMVRNHLLQAVRFHEAMRRDGRRNVAEEDCEEQVAYVPTTPEAVALGEQITIVREVLSSLPERPRTVLEMRLLEEAPFAEIATALGYASADVARNAFHEAQARLLVKLRARGVKP